MTTSTNLQVSLVWWAGTLAWLIFLLLTDLYLNKRSKESSLKKATLRCIVWISLGLALGAVIWWRFGAIAGGKYYAGYVIEESLSVDNIFVWGLLLAYLRVPKKYHYKVLFWGVFGAMFFRSVFVFFWDRAYQ